MAVPRPLASFFLPAGEIFAGLAHSLLNDGKCRCAVQQSNTTPAECKPTVKPSVTPAESWAQLQCLPGHWPCTQCC